MTSFFKKLSSRRNSLVDTPGFAPTNTLTISAVSKDEIVTPTPTESASSALKPKDSLEYVPEQYRGKTLTDEQKGLGTASVPALEAHGFEITKLFYNNLTEKYPVVKNVFNKSNQETYEQPKALALAVI